jgi:hypothetical protein
MESKTVKIFLAILIFSGIIWIGGLHIRAVIGFDLLEMGTLDFKPNIHPYVERVVFRLIAQSSIIVDCAYIIVWIAGLFYLRLTHRRLKENGWLLMCAILFYMFTPVEIYTIVLDTRMWLLDHVGSNDLVEFRKLFIHRLAALSGVPTIALLSYYTVIVVAVFQPFRRSREEKNSSND